MICVPKSVTVVVMTMFAILNSKKKQWVKKAKIVVLYVIKILKRKLGWSKKHNELESREKEERENEAYDLEQVLYNNYCATR